MLPPERPIWLYVSYCHIVHVLENGWSVVDNCWMSEGSDHARTVDTGPLLQSLGGSTDEKTVKERLGGEETLVLEERDLEVDVIGAIPFLGGFTLDETLGLQRAELVLHKRVLVRERTEVGKVVEAFLLASCCQMSVESRCSPLRISQRGEKGMKTEPMQRMMAGTSWIARGTRHAASD